VSGRAALRAAHALGDAPGIARGRFSGNVGQAAAVHEWTIEAGAGPAAVILDVPDELTNQTEATFTIEAPGATRLECSLNDGDAEGCRARAVFEANEGENTLVFAGSPGTRPGRRRPTAGRWTPRRPR
jgi:hypothetical protein